MQKTILLLICLFYLSNLFGQFFEGQIEYVSSYLDNKTQKPIIGNISEIVTIKGGKYKIYIPNAQGGQLEWKIDNFYDGFTYSRKSYKNTNYPVTDKEPIISSDGALTFPKPDSPLVAPIFKDKLCATFNDTLSRLEKMDTTITINNLPCSVLIEYRNGQVKAYYYCYSVVKMDPTLYSCKRKDGLDKVYKQTNGALIAQMVIFDQSFIYVYQAQNVKANLVNDTEFDIPQGIKVQEIQN